MVDHPNGFDHTWVAEKGKRTDPLSRHDRRMVGESRRLDIPLSDDVTVRWVGELLEKLGREMQEASRRDATLRSRLLDAKHAIAEARYLIQERVGTLAGCRPTYTVARDNAPEPHEGLCQSPDEVEKAD